MAKFRNEWVKIVNLLIKAYFWLSPVTPGTHCISEFHVINGFIKACIKLKIQLIKWQISFSYSYGHNIKIIHFIGTSKPWHVKFDQQGKDEI